MPSGTGAESTMEQWLAVIEETNAIIPGLALFELFTRAVTIGGTANTEVKFISSPSQEADSDVLCVRIALDILFNDKSSLTKTAPFLELSTKISPTPGELGVEDRTGI